jgi:hypothetical protein
MAFSAMRFLNLFLQQKKIKIDDNYTSASAAVHTYVHKLCVNDELMTQDVKL